MATRIRMRTEGSGRTLFIDHLIRGVAND